MKFATNLYDITHLTLGMLLHYFGKLKIHIFCRYLADMEENANKLHFQSPITYSSTNCDILPVQLLQQEAPEFIAPDLWPPNSPDLNPVDYRVCGIMQERIYKTALLDTADVKQHLIEAWSSIAQTVINEAIDEWGLRLQARVKAKRRHFEHLL